MSSSAAQRPTLGQVMSELETILDNKQSASVANLTLVGGKLKSITNAYVKLDKFSNATALQRYEALVEKVANFASAIPQVNEQQQKHMEELQVRLQQAETHIGQQRHQFSSLTEQMEIATQTLTATARKNSQLESTVQDLTQTVASLKLEIETLTAEVAQKPVLEQALIANKETLAKLEAELAKAEAGLAEATLKFSQENEQLTERLTSEITSLKTQTSEISAQLDTKTQLLAVATEALTQAQSTIELRGSSLNTQNATILELQDKVQTLSTEIETLQKTNAELQTSLEKALSLVQQATAGSEELESLVQNNQSLASQIGTLEETNTLLSGQIAQLSGAQESLTAKETELASAMEKLHTAESQISQLKGQSDSQLETIQKQGTQIEHLETQNGALATQAEQSAHKIEELNSELSANREELETVQKRQEETNAQIQTLEAQIEELTLNLPEIGSMVQADPKMLEEIDNLKEKLAFAEAQNEALGTSGDDLQRTVTQLTEQLQELQKSNGGLEELVGAQEQELIAQQALITQNPNSTSTFGKLKNAVLGTFVVERAMQAASDYAPEMVKNAATFGSNLMSRVSSFQIPTISMPSIPSFSIPAPFHGSIDLRNLLPSVPSVSDLISSVDVNGMMNAATSEEALTNVGGLDITPQRITATAVLVTASIATLFWHRRSKATPK